MSKSVSLAVLAALAATATFTSPLMAQGGTPDARARAALKALAPAMTVDSVKPAAMPGYQEVQLGGQVVYVSNDGRYLVQGSVLDMTTRIDLTEASKVKARQASLAKVGKEQRISFPAQNEKYKLTVFTDIDCGWCQKMHQQMAEYNSAGITVDYLFFPRAGLEGDSFKQAVAVWCSKDRRAALTQAKSGQRLTGSTACANPVADQFNLGMRLGVQGTPTIYSSTGVDMRGYKAPQEMAAALAALKAPPAAAAPVAAKPASGGAR